MPQEVLTLSFPHQLTCQLILGDRIMAGNTIEISQKGAKIRLASFPHNYPLDTVSHFVNNGKTYKTYSAYKLAIRNRSWISANTKNLRLITDAEFAGL